jgi:hypothetical protein
MTEARVGVTDGYLAAAGQAVTLLGEPDVAAAWDQPSALAEMTVSGLAGHLAYQIFMVSAALDELASQEAPIPLPELRACVPTSHIATRPPARRVTHGPRRQTPPATR